MMNFADTLTAGIFAIALCVLLSAGVLAQQDSLDDELFSDLAPLEERTPKLEQRSDGIDRQLQRELGGSDLGQRRSSNPLQEVAETMQQVRARIQKKDLATETQQIQGRIVSRLDRLIAELRQQKQQQQEQKPKSQRKQQSKPNSQSQKSQQQKPGSGKPGDKPSSQPANDSSTRLGNADATEADAETRYRMMQEAWGNLPTGVQQQMRSARPDRFLPKYSRLIEEYFKRLAEQRRDR